MNTLLIVVIAIILVTGILGYYKGLIKTVLSMATIVLSVVLTSIVAPEAARILCENEEVYGSVYETVSENIDLSDVTKELAAQAGDTLDEAAQAEILDNVGMPPIVREIIIDSGNLEKFVNDNSEKFEEYVYSLITDLIINSSTYVIVFIVFSIVIAIVSSALNIISKLPVLKSLNRMAGAVLGVVEGFVIVWLLFILISVIPGNEFMEKCNEEIEDNAVLTYLYDNNVIMNVVSGYAQEMEDEYVKEIIEGIENEVADMNPVDDENVNENLDE